MYSGWISNRFTIENECGEESVLNNFSPTVGRDVAVGIIKGLVHQKSSSKEFFFKSEKDLDWTMDVICFGLTMPLTDMELETIKNCVYLYLDWSSVLSAKPKPGIPSQIIQNKEHYFGKILKHLANMFIPRESSTTAYQNKFCTQILFHLKSLVQESNIGKIPSEDVLQFYLGISGHLLSGPPMTGGLAELLCEHLINCLITVWLHISCVHFPSPTLWCTLQEMLMTWRHHHILIVQWNKLTYVLTCKVLTILFGPNYSLPVLYKKDPSEPILLPNNMSDEIAVQCWFRFLHCIGNPVELANEKFSDDFKRYSMEHNQPQTSHSSLKSLPKSFLNAMQGVAVLVKMFLGMSTFQKGRTSSFNSQAFARGEWKSASTGTMEIHSASIYGSKSATVPGVRRIADRTSMSTKTVRDDSNMKPKFLDSLTVDVNCILHIFGGWLFDVCLSGVNIKNVLSSIGVISCGHRPHSYNLSKEDIDLGKNLPPVIKNDFEPGRAQAFSTICQIFCHQKIMGQAILPDYLSRFYLTLAVGLCYGETRSGQVLGEVLLNTTDIFRIDLQGVQVLIPHFLQAIEIILPSMDISLGYDISLVMLRRSCIHILLSILCLPLHFLQLPIQGLCKEKVPNNIGLDASYLPQVTFISLKTRLTEILKKALESETDSENTQLLLAGVMLLMEDTMHVENKNDEYIKSHPEAKVPCIVLENVDETGTRSPKLLHIAKTGPIKHVSSEPSKLGRADKLGRKSEIGRLGKINDTNTTKGIFVYLTKFLRQNLMFADKDKSWRTDLSITLAGLECLSNMAHFESKFIDEQSGKVLLKWLCDYIEFQAKKPPPSHTKELHSIIVAAFNCIFTWLINHPWLVDDKLFLDAVLEVIELGISGSKSKPAQDKQETPALKADKELKPVSYRVRDAAESLLALLMEQLDIFPNPCGPSTVSTLLDEEAVMSHCQSTLDKKFKYFASDSTLIIGLLEDSIRDPKETSPTAVAILRGPVGKKVCSLSLRQFPRGNKELAEHCKRIAPLPLPSDHIPDAPPVSQQHFPTEVERVGKTRADSSIPDINAVLNEKQKDARRNMESLMRLQAEQEELTNQHKEHEKTVKAKCQKQPEMTGKMNATRLFLSHLGFLRCENLELSNQQQPQGLVSLTEGGDDLSVALQSLDAYSTRTYDTVHVFFVKRGQYGAKDISCNEIPTLDSHLFMEFLHSLGWPVNTATHTGWNGDVTTSWRTKLRLADNQIQQTGKKMFYYSDLMTELAIHVPSLNLDQSEVITTTSAPTTPNNASTLSETFSTPSSVESSPQQQQHQQQYEQDMSDESKDQTEVTDGKHHPNNSYHNLQSSRRLRKQATIDNTTTHDIKPRHHSSRSETKIVVAWLQDFKDHEAFPALDLVELCDPQEHTYSAGVPSGSRVPDREVVIIYIHPLKTGLFRIMVATAFGSSIGGPLVDGMVCSRRVLGAMVRNTAINICRRRRLEIDSYSPPHACRKIRIQEIVRKHVVKNTIPEFYASIMLD